MCLTTTANLELRKQVESIVGLKNPKVFPVSPCKTNIIYLVKPHEDNLKAVKPLIDNLKRDPSDFPRTIIYCCKLSDCRVLCLLFQEHLGELFTNPPDAPDVLEFRVVESQ